MFLVPLTHGVFKIDTNSIILYILLNYIKYNRSFKILVI